MWTRSKLLWLCMSEGPEVLYPDDELAETSCVKTADHEGAHDWWSDDGSVTISWVNDWSFEPIPWEEDDEQE